MPQMSSMDWFMLMLFFLVVYLMFLVNLYFMLNLNFKKKNLYNLMNNFFKIEWY